jgi:8-oxo-dGTP pyrophosphatase MutT (NUDIX family)
MATVIVFVTNTGDVLVGCGGQWRMDNLERSGAPAFLTRSLAAKQRFPGLNNPASRQAAIAAFTERRGNKFFTNPEWKDDGKEGPRWTTRFVEPECDRARMGFIKGSMEAIDNGDPKNTAIREMREETGFEMNRQKLVDLGNNTFHYPAENVERFEIEERWRALPTRELVEIRWYSILYIRDKHLNAESMSRLESLPDILPAQGGSKKTRRRRRRGRKVGKTRRS